eukprot:TRINITY_DN27394_c0_g3_i2.p2 TRINITY_DN27394_c0_g3~~TRINITY_DN27394_c0_g3_i2.p2  ORF type:complete len:257 (+),score=45.14 TRINITY_DN27394_c0_g3_i2:62-832(+)
MQSLTVSKPTPLKLQTSGKKRVINSVINYSKNYNQVQKHQTSNSLNQLVFNISKCQNRRTIIRQAEEGVEVDLELEVEEIELDTEERMDKTIEIAQENFSTIRTGRASADMVNKIEVSYYGAPTPLLQLASISVPDASQILIGPFDKSAIGDIEKALIESDLGITPNNDGEKIRLTIPQLTSERRKEMSKTVSKLGEEAKVAVRNVRRDALKKVGKLDLPEDTEKAIENTVQKLTDKSIKKIDDLISSKQKELETV